MSLSYNLARAIGGGVPYLASCLYSSLNKKRSRTECFNLFAWRLHRSRLRNIKLIINLPEIDGKAIIRPFSTDKTIVHEICVDKVYEKVFKIPQKGVVIDVGAHIGLFTIKAAKIADKVIAIEPESNNFILLLRNIMLNKLYNVLPLNVALSDREGISYLSICLENLGAHSLVRRRGHCIKVRTCTLDKLLQELDISLEEVSFIKLDVEDAEYLVLCGAKRLLSRGKPFIAMESEYKEVRRKVIKLLSHYNYKIFISSLYLYAYPLVNSHEDITAF